MKKIFLLCLIYCLQVFGENIKLINNSIYPLIAEIYDASGVLQASIRIDKNQMHIWYSDNSPFKNNNDQPRTPYSVHWLCMPNAEAKNKDGEKNIAEFGVWPNVPSGATVTSLGSPLGSKTCSTRVPKDKETDQKTKDKTNGFNNWSNDGGQTWTND